MSSQHRWPLFWSHHCAEASDELFGGDDGIGSGSNMHFDPVGWHATGTLQVGGRGAGEDFDGSNFQRFERMVRYTLFHVWHGLR